MSRVATAARELLRDPATFSRLVLRRPLRRYQIEPLRAILDSVLYKRGREFLLIFPRQSGKNETVSQLLVYLLNLYQRVGGTVIFGSVSTALGMAQGRIAAALNNPWNAGRWHREADPERYCLGAADVTFLSCHPQAKSRGHTAHLLVVIDEAQDQVGSHIEAVFTPMRAANNASAVYMGTVKTTTDFLWQKKLQLEREQTRDAMPRVWLVPPEAVIAENPTYRIFLEAQIRKYGRHHPIVASEYYLQPLDAANAGLFPVRRRALMHGTHPRRHTPDQRHVYAATLDVAGEDEATTDPIARLDHPARDYTVATVFDVLYPEPGSNAGGPTYHAVDVFVDHGGHHFRDLPDRPAVANQLLSWLDHWQVAHLVADESGVGLGLVAWLREAMGPERVTGYQFAGHGKKAALGSQLVALVETRRFHYWTGDEEEPLSDGWWFWRQTEACAYDLPPDGRFDTDLRWGVHPAHRTDTPTGPQPTHDDRLLSAALIAEADRMVRAGTLLLAPAHSLVIRGRDPLANLTFEGGDN